MNGDESMTHDQLLESLSGVSIDDIRLRAAALARPLCDNHRSSTDTDIEHILWLAVEDLHEIVGHLTSMILAPAGLRVGEESVTLETLAAAANGRYWFYDQLFWGEDEPPA